MNNEQSIIIYQTENSNSQVEVAFKGNDLWLSLNQIAKLFDRDKSVISRHISNIFKEKELDKNSTVAFFATVQYEGGHNVERKIEHFNLDVIISVGYRVNSKQGTQFRQWATTILSSYLYLSNRERAAHLLYFVIKDHPFSDGNKRIGCLLFLIFMKKAKLLMPDNNTLIALALLIAESDPKQKDLMTNLIMNLINE